MLRRYSSFYYVQAENKIWECRLRGKQRLKKQDVIAGDRVILSAIDEKQGVIEEIIPRTTELYRPMIANASQLLIVASLKLPSPDWVLLDRLLILGSFSGLKPLIAFNKLDLADEKDLVMPNYYKKIGYDVFLTSAKKKIGLDSLEPVFQNEMTVFAGPSGAGKSSLLNAIDNELKLQTGVVSGKLGRGKHTTRQVELLNLKFGGFVADTPGFSKLDLPKDIKREKLADYFPDIAAYHGLCKFNTCLHRQEPACEVVKAVENGTISRERYENYCCFLDEVIAQERSY